MNKTSAMAKLKMNKDEQGGSWPKVLEDAQAALDGAKLRVRAIKRSIRSVQEKIRNGDPWPGGGANASTQN